MWPHGIPFSWSHLTNTAGNLFKFSTNVRLFWPLLINSYKMMKGRHLNITFIIISCKKCPPIVNHWAAFLGLNVAPALMLDQAVPSQTSENWPIRGFKATDITLQIWHGCQSLQTAIIRDVYKTVHEKLQTRLIVTLQWRFYILVKREKPVTMSSLRAERDLGAKRGRSTVHRLYRLHNQEVNMLRKQFSLVASGP